MLGQKVPDGTVTYRQVQKRLGQCLQGEGELEVVPSSRSSTQERYKVYLRQRQVNAGVLRTFYERLIMRRHRYDAYCGRRSSIDKFIKRIQSAFGEDVVLLYGAWGDNPNLKHQPPSPGVGLRRQIASRITVVRVWERNTSSRCPKCGSDDLAHPRQRCARDSRTKQDVHHLLRCGRPSCRSWWNRDVLGSLNIGMMARHALEHGSWHPLFTA